MSYIITLAIIVACVIYILRERDKWANRRYINKSLKRGEKSRQELVKLGRLNPDGSEQASATPPVKVQFSIRTEHVEPEAPAEKDLRAEKEIDGWPCVIKYHSDYRQALTEKDPEDYWNNPRRWVDIYYCGKKYGYTWPEGTWTRSADMLPQKSQIERWICSELDISAQEAPEGAFKTTNRQNVSKKVFAQGRFDKHLIQTQINPRGYIVPFNIDDFEGRLNTKTEELEISERHAPLAPGVKYWLHQEYLAAKAASKDT